MKCSALFVLANPFYFVVFMFYVVLGIFCLLIPNDLQCKLSKLNLTFLKATQNLKMKIDLRRNEKIAKKDTKTKLRNENKVSILILPLFPNHEFKLKVKFAIDV